MYQSQMTLEKSEELVKLLSRIDREKRKMKDRKGETQKR